MFINRNESLLLEHYFLSARRIAALEQLLSNETPREKAFAIENNIDRNLRKLVAIELRTRSAALRRACSYLIDHHRFDRNWRAYLCIDVC